MSTLDRRVINTDPNNKLYYFFAMLDQTFYRLLAFSGLRVGEALALTWSDIDFEARTLTVNKTSHKRKQALSYHLPKQKLEPNYHAR